MRARVSGLESANILKKSTRNPTRKTEGQKGKSLEDNLHQKGAVMKIKHIGGTWSQIGTK